jgi:crotonobetaine/carnitine-CoA ligase
MKRQQCVYIFLRNDLNVEEWMRSYLKRVVAIVSFISGMSREIIRLIFQEYKRGNLMETIRLTRKNGHLTIAHDVSHAGLLQEKANLHGDRPFLKYYNQTFTYKQMDLNANRVANYLLSIGAGPGQKLAIMMKNSPRWLDAFFGAQRIGMCAVPVNIALKGDQLLHIFNHSEARFVCIDHDLIPSFEKIKNRLISVPQVLVNLTGCSPDFQLPAGYLSLDRAYGTGISEQTPAIIPREGDPCLLMYTSGTTGLPKGVPTYYGKTNIRMLGVLNRTMLRSDDVYFTCLPLFHANSLILTVTSAMNADAQVALSEKFSASRFWDEIRATNATVFNTIGGIIPILMKQPEKTTDRQHRVRCVLSAACPANMWEPFEKRFGVKIIEGYGAVDTGGFLVLNFGQAPVGSMGKPIGSKYRIVDDNMQDMPPGSPGELIFYAGKKNKRPIEYYKDEKATSSKVTDGWLHTGDLVYADKKGYLYFVGRKTESLRRRGENISAYEVEHAILQYPGILECAVYAVPSELGEDDVMAAVVPIEGKTLDVKEVYAFLQEHLARFAIPRYFRVMQELPKTETQRVIKGILSKEGVTPDTIDMEKMQNTGV